MFFFFPILFGGFDNHDICNQTSTTEIFTVTKSDLPLLLLHLLLDQVIIKEYDYYNVDSVVPISFYDHYHYSYLLWLYTYTTTIPFFLGEIHPPIFFWPVAAFRSPRQMMPLQCCWRASRRGPRSGRKNWLI